MTGGAYSKKYAAVPPGKTVSTPGAAALAAREAEKAPSPAEQRIKELNQNPALRDLNHPDNARLRKELREAVAAAATDEERDALANEPIYTLRSRFGIEDPKTKLPHPELRERWDAEAEAVGLASLANWGVDAPIARDVHAFVVERGVQNMGGTASEEDYADFAKTFKGKLSDGQIEALIEWHRGLGQSG